MKVLVGIILGVIITLLFIVVFSENQNMEDANNETMGQLYFGVTDDTADITSINEINLEIEKIEVYNQAEGWIEISSNSKTYALLDLKARERIESYNVKSVSAGMYDQVRITLGDIEIETKTEGTERAIVPSQEITFDAQVVVKEGMDTHVTLDFLADKSLHTTEDEEYVFASVIEVESRSNTEVLVSSTDNRVVLSGGSVDSQITVGVNLNGSALPGFVLNSENGLSVDTSVEGDATFILGDKEFSPLLELETMSESESSDVQTVELSI